MKMLAPILTHVMDLGLAALLIMSLMELHVDYLAKPANPDFVPPKFVEMGYFKLQKLVMMET